MDKNLKSGETVARLVDIINDVNPLQGKQLQHLEKELSLEELKALEELISFYQIQGDSLERQADSYLRFVADTMRETKYFFEHDTYRYHTFDEVARHVYFDRAYMHDYMQGLGISQYLWPQHLSCIRFFHEICVNQQKVRDYLEIGPGHGQYLREAVRSDIAEQYTALDISETSLEFTKRLIDHFIPEKGKFVQYECGDASQGDMAGKYNFIVLCEVLEHVEHPLELLQNLRKLLVPGGHAFVSVPVNGPAVDHIYLFRTVDEATAMAGQAGFKVVEQRAFLTGKRSLEWAVKNKDAILVAMLLE